MELLYSMIAIFTYSHYIGDQLTMHGGRGESILRMHASLQQTIVIFSCKGKWDLCIDKSFS